MAEPYLTEIKLVIERALGEIEGANGVVCKHFFSGAAAYMDGQIFMSLSPVGLALKLPPEKRDELFAQGGSALRYFPKAPVKKGYVVLPKNLVEDDLSLKNLIVQSLQFAIPDTV